MQSKRPSSDKSGPVEIDEDLDIDKRIEELRDRSVFGILGNLPEIDEE